MRKTVAILGGTGEFLPEVMEVLLKKNLRLLFISENETEKIKLEARLKQLETIAEVDFTSCEREGCWEAEIIVLTGLKVTSSLLEKIKEVATQKIVVIVPANEQLKKVNLQQLLPHSKVVEIFPDSLKKEFSLSGKDAGAKERIQEIFSSAGYKFRQLSSDVLFRRKPEEN